MDQKKIVIVGGVAGGASAAARARRLSEEAEIILLERGPYISFANCGLPYHIGGEIAERDRLLVTTPELLRTQFRIDVRTRNEVMSIDPDQKEVEIKNLETGEVYKESYDSLVLSPGADPVRPPIPGIESNRVLSLRNMEDMDRIISELKGREHASVIGGGYIGLEMAEALRRRGIATTLVELAPQVMGPADPEMVSILHQELEINGVDLRLGTSVSGFEETEKGLKLTLSSGEALETGLAILAIGVKPETTLATGANIVLGPRGGIKVNDRMQTSVPDIYAVGDAVEVIDFVTREPALIPLAGPANRQGRIAADNIFGRSSRYKDTQGTAICKVFNLAIGMTGLSEKAAKHAGVAYEKIYVHPASHASYYPGSAALSMKMLFDPETGKVLGAQVVGADGVDKRIDVFAVAIRAGLTVYDLEELELSYAPPFGSAKDPVNFAGFVAANILRGDAKICQVEDVINPAAGQKVLDIRTPDEVSTGTIPGAKNIPLDDLRDRLDDLDKEKEYLIFCRVGLRGYLACRILSQNGFNCRNLTGGYITYQRTVGMAADEMPEDHKPESDSDYQDVKKETPMNLVKTINACGQQCPGPILQLKNAIDEVNEGEAVCISATDPGFVADAPAWCHSTGHELASMDPGEGGSYRATVIKRAGSRGGVSMSGKRAMTNVVFSNDFDKAVAAFIIANGAAAAGYDVTLFFTFWGINMLRKSGPVVAKKNLIEKMFGIMMPKGADKLALSQMNMGGMGLAMIKGIMKKKNVMTLPELIGQARMSGVKLVVCTMSMDLMGIKKEELIDGIEEGGVAMYVDHLTQSNANLFI
ncbi:FAD-dependent oxidoreductase [Tichowtungia aerotolerans]|uniref:FAD-dependent oxidoreductase n=1 Tax=Tichowtungia aerotolerans TaxID=2697043 RepID=A0A6P1M553_9BACT|nr:FAD-dependent oxidoreductase [Tichowtungia aerotolerans]QHI69919.1 FAD-dependent oxidoreductase [Tichowtungia aerotolerans]